MVDIRNATNPRGLQFAQEQSAKVVELAEQVVAQRDEWQRNFIELGESLAVKLGEAIDLLSVGRTEDAQSLLESLMRSLDKIGDPTKRGGQ